MQSELAGQPPAATFSQQVAPELSEEEKDAQDSSLYKEDSFRMYCMKVLPCSKRYCHDWTTCPFSHPGEKARRRDPRTQPHTGIACPDRKKEGTCIRGDNCPYAHNVFEYWLHPTRYRTQLCNDGSKCRRHICFFAHSLEELRVPSVKPFVPPDALAAATTAAAADLARKTATANAAGAANALDAVTLRALAEAVLSGAASSQQDSQAAELARSILRQPNTVTNSLVNQLAQLQVQQNQQLHLQQQQQEQLNAMSMLSAYLQNPSALGQGQSQHQSQHQSQLPHMPQLPEQHSVDSWQQDQSVGPSERQQLAFRSLSEAAADQHSSDMIRAHLAAQTLVSASASLPSNSIAHGAASLHAPASLQASPSSHVPAVTAGTTLAQQSLLYAPTQLGQQSMSKPSLQPMLSQFSPHGFAQNPFGSHSNSFDLPRSSLSDLQRLSSINQQDWMSTGTRYSMSTDRFSGDRFSRDRFSGDRFSHDRFSHDGDMLTPGSGFAVGSARRSSFGGAFMGSSFDHDWAGRPVARPDLSNFAGLPPTGQDQFNPVPHYAPLQHEAYRRDGLARDGFHQQVFHRASQDSDASTHMHTDGRPSIDDRQSMESVRSGLRSPHSPPAHRPDHCSDYQYVFAGHRLQSQQQQHQQYGVPSPRNTFLGSLGGLLASSRGLDSTPEDTAVKDSHHPQQAATSLRTE